MPPKLMDAAKLAAYAGKFDRRTSGSIQAENTGTSSIRNSQLAVQPEGLQSRRAGYEMSHESFKSQLCERTVAAFTALTTGRRHIRQGASESALVTTKV
uniref:Uncharacterized protein n=1 Tax=Trichuris muris TaxID=70415 RepID=A0A5S6Q9G1_TRIMR